MSSSPFWVYDNWTAYTDSFGELDTTRLTEGFAMEQLRNVERARVHGLKVDYYLMDAFWFEPDGGYLEWRQPDWPDGPDRWIAECGRIGVKPGLWFGSNTMWKLNPRPEWVDSVDPERGPSDYGFNGPLSMSDGSFFSDFLRVLQHWYDRGIRLFEFDVADFDAGTARQRSELSQAEIRERNIVAFVEGLSAFRAENFDVKLVGFNSFGGEIDTTSSPVPFENPVDPRFIEVLESLYTGDVRVSDVPHQDFWRSTDIYTDHMQRRFQANGVPLDHTDPFGFVMSTTWIAEYRGTKAWRGMALLTAARGSRKKTLFGDLGLLREDEIRWFARVQETYEPLLEGGTTRTFGGMPGDIEPYGFVSVSADGALHLVMNPTQEIREVVLPEAGASLSARVLFADAGFEPVVSSGALSLGPGQLALVGSGRFDSPDFDFGVEPDIVIPRTITQLNAESTRVTGNSVEVQVTPPAGALRVVCQQRNADGWAHRTIEHDPESAERLKVDEALRGRALDVQALQDGAPVQDDRSSARSQLYGMSWVLAEIPGDAISPGTPVTIRCTSRDTESVELHVDLYSVGY